MYKSNLSLNSLDYAEACNELAGLVSASLRPGNTAPFEEMSQRWRAVGDTVSDLTGPRFESQTSRSRDERVTARPTGIKDKKKFYVDFNVYHTCFYTGSYFQLKSSSLFPGLISCTNFLVRVMRIFDTSV